MEPPVVHTQRLASPFRTVVHHRRGLPIGDKLRQLLHIRRAREKQNQVLRESRELRVQRRQRVGLHGLQIEDLIRSVSGAYAGRLASVSRRVEGRDGLKRWHTSPRRTRKDNAIRRQILELILQNVKAVSLKPGDPISDPVDLGVVLRAPQNSRVLLDGVNALPLPGERKCDGVSSCTGEGIDQDPTLGGSGAGDMICDFTRKEIISKQAASTR